MPLPQDDQADNARNDSQRPNQPRWRAFCRNAGSGCQGTAAGGPDVPAPQVIGCYDELQGLGSRAWRDISPPCRLPHNAGVAGHANGVPKELRCSHLCLRKSRTRPVPALLPVPNEAVSLLQVRRLRQPDRRAAAAAAGHHHASGCAAGARGAVAVAQDRCPGCRNTECTVPRLLQPFCSVAPQFGCSPAAVAVEITSWR